MPAAQVAYRFRRSLRATWRQGIHYGRGRPSIANQAASLGLAAKSPTLVTRSGRHAWIFTLAVRWGVVLGAVKARRLFI